MGKKHKIIYNAIRAVLSTCSIMLDTAYVGLDYSPGYEAGIFYNDIESLILFILLYYIFSRFEFSHEDTKRLKPLALFFAVVVFFGRAYMQLSQAYIVVFSSFARFIISVLYLYGLYSIVSLALGIIYEYFFYKNHNEEGNITFLSRMTEKKRTIFIFIILCWIPYWIIYFPGSNSWDAGYAISKYFAEGIVRNGMPAFQLYLFIVPLKISKAVFDTYIIGYAFYSFVQMVVVAAIISYAISLMGKYNVYKKYQIITLLFVSFIPVFPFYAMTLCDDTPFAVLVLMYSLLLAQIYFEKSSERKTRIVLCFVLILMCLFRHQGLYIVCIGGTILILLTILQRKYYAKIIFIHFICIFFMFLYNGIVVPRIITTSENDINVSSTRAILSVVICQQFADWYCSYGEELDADEYNELKRFVNFEAISEGYNPDLSDNVTRAIDYRNMSQDDWNYFFRVWIKQGFKHPLTYIRATVNMTYGYIYPNYRVKTGTWPVTTELQMVGNSQLNLFHPEILSPLKNRMDSIWRWLFNTSVFGVFFNAGIYSWMLIIAVYFVWVRNYDKECLIILFPSLATLAVCFASPVNGLVRYALPIIMSMPILLGFFLQMNDRK